jgi:hypothetical protein
VEGDRAVNTTWNGLARTQPLARGTGFGPRTVPLATGSGFRVREPLVQRSREGGKSAPRTSTLGPGRDNGPSDEVRDLVLTRDGFCCTCCGQSIEGQEYSLGRRLRASQGGRPVASNLLVCLGWGGEQHRGRIDSRRDRRDEDRSLAVRSGQDPAQVPVTVCMPFGELRETFLWDDGRYHDEGPQEMTAVRPIMSDP